MFYNGDRMGDTMNNKDNILHMGEGRTLSYAPDKTLYQNLWEQGLWTGDAPCGGKGTCGKCKIIVTGGHQPPLSEKELISLTPYERQQGFRLACLIKTSGEIHVSPGRGEEGAVIQQDHFSPDETDPPVKALTVDIPPASLEDQRDTLTALREEGAKHFDLTLDISYSLISSLPCRSDEGDMRLSLLCLEDRVVAVKRAAGEGVPPLYGAIVDLGTTTVVLYLVDLNRGEVADTIAAMNSQRARGGDVISRIEYAEQGPDNLSEMGKIIGSQIARMADEAAGRQGIRPDLFLICGNPAMIHLLGGFNPSGIARAPFVPLVTETLYLKGKSLFLPGYERASLILPACLSGYIGSDILSGVLYTGMDTQDELSLLLDLGTNGELVLGNREGLAACSCAAGPAFEGANISAGMAGVAGAVSHVEWEGEVYAYKTIAAEPAAGLCGTGIIDVMALLLEKGIVDETGRFLDEEELTIPDSLKARVITDGNGDRAFLVAAEADRGGRDITFTQRDVREVQMARAAIAGAVTTLLRVRNIALDEVSRVYLAGGFGFWLREVSAIRIGLIPPECAGKVQVVGNSSGKGGILMALDRSKLARADELRKEIEYLELSCNPEYQNDYIMAMTFPERNR
jgi:uncharacterized 2Fe-2S/4Fe-4S cluster protein (DUF4445 family)